MPSALSEAWWLLPLKSCAFCSCRPLTPSPPGSSASSCSCPARLSGCPSFCFPWQGIITSFCKMDASLQASFDYRRPPPPLCGVVPKLHSWNSLLCPRCFWKTFPYFSLLNALLGYRFLGLNRNPQRYKVHLRPWSAWVDQEINRSVFTRCVSK